MGKWDECILFNQMVLIDMFTSSNISSYIITVIDCPHNRSKYVFEVSVNDFLYIQWIMTKSNSSMVTGDVLHLTIDTFLDEVVKKNFPLLSVGWYLFRVVSGNRYLSRGSNKNVLCITSTGNVFAARWVIPLVTIPLGFCHDALNSLNLVKFIWQKFYYCPRLNSQRFGVSKWNSEILSI